MEWSEEYGECDGSDQLFDFVVDRWETVILIGWEVKVSAIRSSGPKL